jgi:hypothetical protein
VHPVAGVQSFEDFISTAKLEKLQCGPKFDRGYVRLTSKVSVEFEVGCVTVGLSGRIACTGFVTAATLAADHGALVT